MKNLFLIMLLMACVCLGASAGPISSDTSKKDTTKVVQKDTKDKGADNTQVTTHSVSDAPGAAIPTPAKPSCMPRSLHRDLAGWALIVLLIVLFFGVAWKSNLLRDPVSDKVAFMAAAKFTKYANVTDINLIPKAFSLARTQLAAWTVVIACTYVYLGLIEHFSLADIGTNTTILTLMGISAGTTAVGSAIDNSSPAQQGTQYPSDNFLIDILSDQNGVNIHRFQNVVWTIIAMVMFLSKVRYMGCGELPTLDGTLIALTGISSATYLGLKVYENNKPAIPPTPPAAAQPAQPQD